MLDPMAQGANGYLIDTGDVTMLHCGDSLYFEAFAELGQRRTIDAICLSVGHNPPGHTYYMTEVDAARAARDANAATLIPQHFDLWQGFTLDPQRVRTAARWYCPDTQVQPARFGQRISITKRPENAPA
jgi:L-ascorbate metabolism protein UlaG (beta-lactamase superfamily)